MWTRCWLPFLPLLWLCACKHQPLPAASPRPQSGDLLFKGACDASGAVALDDVRFAVADDEDNSLRVYDAQHAGAPLTASDLSAALGLVGREHSNEADLEAGTRVGDVALWLTSHGRSSQGEREPSRMRFFATTIPQHGEAVALVGQVYDGLLTELIGSHALSAFQLDQAAKLAPKSPGGLNIEGLSVRRDQRSVFIGFRNPVPEGRALLVPMYNPLTVVRGQKPELGVPTLLGLDGLGIRAITLWHDQYWIIGGTAENYTRDSRLFRWDGEHAPEVVQVDLHDFNAEALVAFETQGRLLLLSDDGERDVGGTKCKDLEDPTRKGFRGRWLPIR